MTAPTFHHCVWVTAPHGGANALRAAGRSHEAPTFPHCVWVTAPQGGANALRAAGRALTC